MINLYMYSLKRYLAIYKCNKIIKDCASSWGVQTSLTVLLLCNFISEHTYPWKNLEMIQMDPCRDWNLFFYYSYNLYFNLILSGVNTGKKAKIQKAAKQTKMGGKFMMF